MFLVAEIGNNWEGDLKLVESMIKNCKKLGFDAVKFQAFGKEHWKNYPQFPQLKNTSISKENIEYIDKLARKYDIEWFCTPTRTDFVELVNSYVKRFKIRFKDQYNYRLIAKIRAKNKPIISSRSELVSWAKSLYCIPNYPTKLKEINFSLMRKYDGFSNHCPSIYAAIWALQAKLEIYEFHITESHKKPYIDNVVSYDYNQLKEIFYSYKNKTQFFIDSPSVPLS